MADKMSKKEAAEMLKLMAALDDDDDGDEDEKSLSTIKGRLQEAYAAYTRKHALAPGMLVTWKDGLRNKKMPEYGEPVIVLEILPTPVIADKDSGSAYFREPLDLVAGAIDEDGDFVIFHYDSRRFEPLDAE